MIAIDYLAEAEAAAPNGQSLGMRERVELDAGIFAGQTAEVIAYDVGVSIATVLRRRRHLRELGCTFRLPEPEFTDSMREEVRRRWSLPRTPLKSSSEKQPTRAA